MSANKRRLSDHPEAVLTCALLASTAPANPAATAKSPVIMNGGGSTLGGEVLAGSGGEFALFNAPTTDKAVFGTFWAAGGGTSQKAFIYDDLTCDSRAGACSGPDGGSGNTVDYAAPEDPLNASQISSWATSSFGQASAGNLIQIPAFGIAPAIVVNDGGLTENGQVELTDNDLCGIYSGLITDFSQITDVSPAPAPGQFQLVYRSDANGLTSLLTNHLNAVCNISNTQAGRYFYGDYNLRQLVSGRDQYLHTECGRRNRGRRGGELPVGPLRGGSVRGRLRLAGLDIAVSGCADRTVQRRAQRRSGWPP